MSQNILIKIADRRGEKNFSKPKLILAETNLGSFLGDQVVVFAPKVCLEYFLKV